MPYPVPLLSFVVPAYRVEAHLPECLDSLLSQAGPDVEVVAVDDGSPERCGEIIEQYARRDHRVRPVRLPENTGLGHARNAGIEHAVGHYLWFVDSDDTLPAGAVDAVRARLAQHWPDVLIVDHAEVHDDGRTVASRPHGILRGVRGPLRLAAHPRLLRAAQSACTKVVRRTFLDEAKLRFPPGWYEDSAFSPGLLIAADRVDVLDQVCYLYWQRHHGAITRSVSARHFEVFAQYDRVFAHLDPHDPDTAAVLPELFRFMVEHYLVIVGNPHRVPAELRPAFFRRMVTDFHARLPPDGYAAPGGLAGVKHRLVRHDRYRLYALLRQLYRVVRALRWGRLSPG